MRVRVRVGVGVRVRVRVELGRRERGGRKRDRENDTWGVQGKKRLCGERGGPEVGDFQVALIVKEEVLGLEVAVHDVVFVHVRQRQHDHGRVPATGVSV